MQEQSDSGTGGQHSGIVRLQSETEDRLGAFAAALREYAILVLDADGRVQRWDAAAEHILGYRGEEVIGEHSSVFSPPEQATSAQATAEQTAAGRPDWRLAQAAEFGRHVDEGWYRRQDGTHFWAHVVTTAQHTADGAATGFLQVLRDETEAGTGRQRSNRRFSDLFDLTPAGIALFTEAGNVLDANEALSNLLGYRTRDLNGMPAISLLHPDDRDAGLIADEAESARQNQPRVRQRVLLSSDGQSVPCEVLSASSVADDGSPFWLVLFQNITEWQRQTDKLRYQATHDELTGLPNRIGLNELLESVLSGGAERVAVLFCDLDNFKRVNDALGHDAGDELLVAVAQRLTAGLPAGCTCAHLSGDEYLIICSDVEAVGGLEPFTTWVAELLRTTVPLRGQLVNVSASVGASMLDADTAGTNLLRYADTAMFHAKSKGPGRISLANRALIGPMEDQLGLEGQLHDALDNDSLTLHYQPILNHDGDVIMAEALVRWPHPDRGLLSPAVILPVAEQGNLLRALDRWVLRTALREAAGWPAPNGSPVDVAVNLVDLLPHDPEFVDAITAALTETGIPPERLVLEMVETSLLELPIRPHEAMIELAERGVRFALDDFGTGYSSLARLKDLPTQILKLDRQFVTGLETDPADFAIAQATIGMGHAMGRNCVAEGVETTGQFHALDNLGIDLYQGWLFSHALPDPEFRAYLDPQQT